MSLGVGFGTGALAKQSPSHYLAVLMSNSLTVSTVEGYAVDPIFQKGIYTKAWKRKATW